MFIKGFQNFEYGSQENVKCIFEYHKETSRSSYMLEISLIVHCYRKVFEPQSKMSKSKVYLTKI